MSKKRDEIIDSLLENYDHFIFQESYQQADRIYKVLELILKEETTLNYAEGDGPDLWPEIVDPVPSTEHL